ncbi:major capsid protein [Aliiroseovarius lamellibrachiae]|uniref:major capsid protein n=1 Tax=Aliiroseovarius lamellibrachiae TaxID=1924933 RepID=UPI001BDFDE48|nr:major capsid protein [Aliiroseovarius lamellibrachiae]MBT2130116.1 major capsid protein [Aliiroseovarius lamellibrachiae]
MEDEFDIVTLTASVNNQPFVPGQMGATGVFDEEGVPTTSIKVEEQNGKLDIIEPSPRGGPGQTVDDDDRQTFTFEVDHFEINDSVNADEIQGVRMFGTNDDLEVMENRIDTKLARHARSMDATLEHQRIGAAKGIVLSGKGKVLHNLYDRFGMAVPAPIVLGLGSEVSGIATKIKGDVVFAIEDELDASYDHIHSLCGRDFHAALWDQKEVRETYMADNEGYRLRDGAPDVFKIGHVTFERYRTGRRAKAANAAGAFIADNEARVFPVGVPDLFITRFAPGDWNGLPNTMGLPRYTRMKAMYNDKGYHLDSQMNAISLCTMPGVLRKLTV